MIATTLASYARPFWRLLKHYGIDPEMVFREAGLAPELLDEPRGRYNAERQAAAWVKAAALIDDPCFGLKIAEHWKSNDLHVLGCALLSSGTLRAALERLSRYVHVIDDVVGYALAEEGDNVSCTLVTENPIYLPPFPPQEDSAWAYITSLCREIGGEDLNPVEVRFEHSAPECTGDFDAFFRCPVRFGSAASAILFAREDVDRALAASNREIAWASDQVLTDFLDELRAKNLIARAKTLIANELPSGAPRNEMIAEKLFLSPRTFQRKLAAKGTSYGEVLDSVRCELTERYLADPTLTISEISLLVGFSGLPALSRAFKRWTGRTLSEAREAAST